MGQGEKVKEVSLWGADGVGAATVANGRLWVDVISGGTGGVQYTEGDTDASITGTAIMWEDTSDTLRAVSAAKPLPVNIVAGSSSGVQYTEGDTDTTITGTAMVFETDTGTSTLGVVSATNPVPITAASLPLPTGAATSANQVTEIASLSVMDDWDNAASDGASVSGDVAHDAADAGEPVKVGHKAIAHGANPTAVAANDRTDWYSNRHGVPWVIGGHPNVISREVTVLDSDGAQTGASLVGTIAAGTKVILTYIDATCDGANTADVAIRVAYSTNTTLPAAALAGVNGVVLSHAGLKAGSGIVKGSGSGIIGIGGDGEELRFTCEDPVGGALRLTLNYYEVPS